jgi:hypothetical protein
VSPTGEGDFSKENPSPHPDNPLLSLAYTNQKHPPADYADLGRGQKFHPRVSVKSALVPRTDVNQEAKLINVNTGIDICK